MNTATITTVVATATSKPLLRNNAQNISDIASITRFDRLRIYVSVSTLKDSISAPRTRTHPENKISFQIVIEYRITSGFTKKKRVITTSRALFPVKL